MFKMNNESRYIKQENLEDFNSLKQKQLLNSKVVVLGLGGLGSKISEILVRSGLGNLLLIDYDKVSLSNLQRQSLYNENDIGKYKSKKLCEKLKKINSSIQITYINSKIDGTNINSIFSDLIKNYKDNFLIIDALDNIKTRFLLNDFCIKHNIPWVFNGITGYEGQTLFIKPGFSACIDCFIGKGLNSYYEPIYSTGIYYPSVLAVASLGASLVLKYFTHNLNDYNCLYKIDFFNFIFKKIKLEKNKNCKTCGIS